MPMGLSLSTVGLPFQQNVLAQILGGAEFVSDMLYTAVPRVAASGTTATFTRATTATFTDFEGVLRTAPAGCARFVGARFVRNLLASVANLLSEDLTSAGWTANAVTKAVGSITETAASSLHYISNNAVGTIGRKHIYQMRASLGSGTRLLWTGDGVTVAEFNLQAGTAAVVAGSGSASMTLVSTGVYDCYLTINSQAATVVNIGLASSTGVYNYAGNGTSSINVSRIQVEDITGRADQTTPSEYVSVGVESAPYHGAGADGCQFFDTDLDGNPLTTMERYKSELAATNSCLRSNAFTTAPWGALSAPTATQNAIGPNGQANYAWTLEDNDAVNYEGYQQNLVAWSAGASGCYSLLVGKKTSSPSYPCLLLYYNRASNLYHYIIVNEVAGTVAIGGSTNPPAYGCVSFNDDYWLVWVSGTQAGATVNTSLDLYPAASVDGTTLSAAKTGSTVFADAQFEQGTTVPSSRIATAGAAVTRNADILTYSGGDVANFKTLMAGFRREVGVSSSGISAALSDGTFNNYEMHNISTATDHAIQGCAGGATQWQISPAAYSPGSDSKVAWSVATNDIKAAFDGVGQTPDTVANVPAISELDVGHIGGSYQLNGNVGPIYGWTRNQSQSELNAVTA